MLANREYSDFKKWCLDKGYCTLDEYNSIDPLKYKRSTIRGQRKYSKAKGVFYRAMKDYVNIYRGEVISKIDSIIEFYDHDTIIYEALLGLYLEHADKH